MTDNILRHLVAICGTLVAGLAYFAGYWSSGHGWWWTVVGVAIIYVILYKLVNT